MRDAAIEQARAAYEQALAAIFQGIAESEGNEAALQDAMEAVNAQGLISDFIANMFTDTGEVNTEALNAVSEAVTRILGDAFNPELLEQYLTVGDESAAAGYLSQISDQIDAASAESISTALGGKLGEAYAAALEGGFLADTSFDTTNQEEQLAAILGAIFDGGAQQAGTSFATSMSAQQDTITGAAETAVSGVGDATDVSSATSNSGTNTANGWISGFNSRIGSMVSLARSAARQITAAFNNTLGIASPSKVFRQSGRFSGEGFALGYEESIRDAQRTVRSITGTLISAANFSSFPMRNAAQAAGAGSAYVADSDTDASLNVGLYINDRKIAEATSDANARVSNARARRMAAGWGHMK